MGCNPLQAIGQSVVPLYGLKFSMLSNSSRAVIGSRKKTI
jgi:hypothetical protein